MENKQENKQEISIADVDAEYIINIDKTIEETKDRIIVLELQVQEDYERLKEYFKKREQVINDLFLRYKLSKDSIYNINLKDKKIEILKEKDEKK